MQQGRVVKLDRGFPLVRTDDGQTFRCEHATALVKGKTNRAVIGDIVQISIPDGHDKGIIERILPRTHELIRKDPTERTLPQILAANFDLIIIAEPLSQVNMKRLERELVLAHETGADVAIVLTKADLADVSQLENAPEHVKRLAGPLTPVMVISTKDTPSIEKVRALIKPHSIAVIIGKSGVGKSSLINLLVGSEVRRTSSVRETDGKGRHTTVNREIIGVPGGGWIVDMPGIRGIGLWDADAGIEAAFPDIEEYARQCRFRDCSHEMEPGCAVRSAVDQGLIDKERLASYLALKTENAQMKIKREEARQMSGQKPSNKKARQRRKGH